MAIIPRIDCIKLNTGMVTRNNYIHNKIHAHKSHQLPHNKRWKRVKIKLRELATNLLAKIENIHSLSINDIEVIATIRHNYLDMTEEEIPIEMIHCLYLGICANSGLTVYWGDVTEAYARSLAPDDTYLAIDDTYVQ